MTRSSAKTLTTFALVVFAFSGVGCAPPEGSLDNPKVLEPQDWRELGQYGQVGSVAFNPDTDRLHVVLNGSGQVELAADDLSRLDVRAGFPFSSQDIAFTRDGSLLSLVLDGAAVLDPESGDASASYLPPLDDPGSASWRGVTVVPGAEPEDDAVTLLGVEWNRDGEQQVQLFAFADPSSGAEGDAAGPAQTVIDLEDYWPTAMVFDEAGGRLLVVETDQLTTFDLLGQPLERYELEGVLSAGGVALDAERSRLWITDTFASDLRIFDLDALNP